MKLVKIASFVLAMWLVACQSSPTLVMDSKIKYCILEMSHFLNRTKVVTDRVANKSSEYALLPQPNNPRLNLTVEQRDAKAMFEIPVFMWNWYHASYDNFMYCSEYSNFQFTHQFLGNNVLKLQTLTKGLGMPEYQCLSRLFIVNENVKQFSLSYRRFDFDSPVNSLPQMMNNLRSLHYDYNPTTKEWTPSAKPCFGANFSQWEKNYVTPNLSD